MRASNERPPFPIRRSKVGYIERSYGMKWNVYAGYSTVGSISGGSGGPDGGAALLLLLA
jgi:hypothetical protein